MPQATPQTFGRYRVIGPLGSGGMAQVFIGYDPLLDREVAIKVISRGEHNAAFDEHFRREARAVAALRHPNIVRVYDYGEHGNSHYMVMELVRGTDLGRGFSARYAQGKLIDLPKVQAILDQVAAGLDYAHARGVIHRDVKPGNILLGEDGTAVLTDFGLVLKLAPGVEPTRGQSLGTPEYVAPEQAMDSARATPRSDVYSLGVVLYLVLTGSLPFNADTPLQTALKHIAETPRRPREVNPALSPAVEAVLLKALEKKPEDRYASAGELARALRAAWTQPAKVVPAQATPAPVTSAAPTKPRRPRAVPPRSWRLWPIIAGGVVLGLVLLVAGLAVIFGDPARRPAFVAAPSATITFTPTLLPTSTAVPLPTKTPTLLPTVTLTPLPTDTPTPRSTPTPLPTATASSTLEATAMPVPTATATTTRVSRPRPTQTLTPTQSPWVGPLGLVAAYKVADQCLGRNPRVWTAWIKLDAQGGNGIYTYYVDDRMVASGVPGDYTYVLEVTDGSLSKTIRITVESAGVFLKDPVWRVVDAPGGC